VGAYETQHGFHMALGHGVWLLLNDVVSFGVWATGSSYV
jgi:hypothetical protein